VGGFDGDLVQIGREGGAQRLKKIAVRHIEKSGVREKLRTHL